MYEAEDPVLGPVAVKIVLPRLLTLTSVCERFLREARLGLAVTASLHQHVLDASLLSEL